MKDTFFDSDLAEGRYVALSQHLKDRGLSIIEPVYQVPQHSFRLEEWAGPGAALRVIISAAGEWEVLRVVAYSRDLSPHLLLIDQHLNGSAADCCVMTE